MKLISHSYKTAQHGNLFQAYALMKFLDAENIPWTGFVNHQVLENNMFINGCCTLDAVSPFPKQAIFAGVHAPKEQWEKVDKTLTVGASNPWSQEQAQETGLKTILTGDVLCTLPLSNQRKTKELFINSTLAANNEELYPFNPKPFHYASGQQQQTITEIRLNILAQAALVHTSDYVVLLVCIAMGIPVAFEMNKKVDQKLSLINTLVNLNKTIEYNCGLRETLFKLWEKGFQEIMQENETYLQKLKFSKTKQKEPSRLYVGGKNKTKPQPAPVAYTAPTAVIITVYGQDEARIKANQKAMTQWLKQDLPVTIYFEEVLFPENQHNVYKETVQKLQTKFKVVHTQTMATDNNRSLFLKECLFNRQARKAQQDKQHILIFLDADTWAEDTQWWRKICQQTLAQENMVVQGFSTLVDTVDMAFNRESVGTEADLKLWAAHPKQPKHPGLCWAMSVTYWETIGGFNENCISGSGDVCFILECLPETTYINSNVVLTYFQNLLRKNLPPAQLGFVDVKLIHENHGSFVSRAYNGSRLVIDWTGDPIQDLVEKDAQGLLQWRIPSHTLKKVLNNKKELGNTPESIYKTCQKYGLVDATKVKPFGWFHWENIYRQIVREAPENSMIVELGVFAGASTVFLATQIQNSGKKIHAYAIDVFPVIKPLAPYYKEIGLQYNGDTYAAAQANLKLTHADHTITLQKMDIHQAFKQFEDESLFAVWLDADHQETNTYKALQHWFPKVQPGGYFGGDDYHNKEYPGVRIAVDKFFAELKLPVQINGSVFLVKKPKKPKIIHSKQPIVLFIRRSKQWYQKNELSFDPTLRDNLEKQVNWWNNNLSVNYVAFRKELKEIAKKTWETLPWNDLIMYSDYELINKLPENSILVPVDEDDWLSPRLYEKLSLEKDLTIRSIVWEALLLKNGTFKPYGWEQVCSCAYALKTPFDKQLINHTKIKHYDKKLDDILSVQNRTPASISWLLWEKPKHLNPLKFIEDIIKLPPQPCLPEFENAYAEYRNLLAKLNIVS